MLFSIVRIMNRGMGIIVTAVIVAMISVPCAASGADFKMLGVPGVRGGS